LRAEEFRQRHIGTRQIQGIKRRRYDSYVIRAWQKSAELAATTPLSRNRAVDFLRAASILVVVLGHWLMAGPWVDENGSHVTHMLAVAPWTHWLTWGFQVMPVFFFVGGYANGSSWEAALRERRPYREWLRSRLERLCRPLLPLLIFWGVAAAIARAAGVPAEMIRVGSNTALVATWFLAVYFVVVILAPLAHAAWHRFGIASFWVPAAAAAGFDALYFGVDLHAPGWANYLCVWLAVHQLGFAWRAGHFAARARALLWCAGGFALLVALTEFGPWPRSLVGVPGEAVSNTTPPHLPVLALSMFQFGAVMLAEPALRRWLARPAPWTATVLMNGSIMTLFLWHSGAMMLLFGVAILLGGVGLAALPGSAEWWMLRPLWVVASAGATACLMTIFLRFERGVRAPRPAPPTWMMIAGILAAGAGISQLALYGVGGAGLLGLRLGPLLLAIGGLLLALAPGHRAAAPAQG
jgi:hypothetical protein